MIKSGQYKKLIFFEIIWVCLVLGVFLLHRNSIKQQSHALVQKEAATIFNKDLAFRTWATSHGGVYVPQSDKTPPNQFLSHIKERDLTTPSNRKLTLMNPAYVLKQIMADYSELFGVKGHITSLKLLNPANKPDLWEVNALELFEKGIPELAEFSYIEGEEYLRFMRPLVVKDGCLKCHDGQGYAVGDIRGGISLSIPLTEYKTLESKSFLFIVKVYVGFGLGGACLIFFAVEQFAKRKREQEEAEITLKKANQQLETQVVERTAELNQTNRKLQDYQSVLEEKVEKRSTELLAAQNKINRQEKLAAIGHLAGTVSHDLRNPLGTINNSIYFLKMKVADGDEKTQKHLNIMEGEIEKAESILADVLDCSRTEQLVLKRHDMPTLIQSLIGLWQFPENICCEFTDPPESAFALIDVHQISRVLNNLINNAIQAMPDGGNLTFSLIVQNETVEIHIKDTGCGIHADNLDMIFEPLFTTKAKGIGLGLSSAKDIVELHGGSIDVVSEVGKGTEFIIINPAIKYMN